MSFQAAHKDTIAAIATAPGQGAVAIVRLSGPGSLTILHRIFCSAHQSDGKKFKFKTRMLHHGWLHFPVTPLLSPEKIWKIEENGGYGEIIDEVLAVFMPGPFSFSGEDAAEIHCHGGSAVANAVLEAVLKAGGRMAEAGEFTQRAFLHGRLDLSQAEAIAELISAPTLEGVNLARQKLQGALAEKIIALKHGLDTLRAHLCLTIDFPDEEASEGASWPEEQAFGKTLLQIQNDLAALISAHDRAKLIREGAMVVLAGQVNAGKSSLLNAMLGRERAIVSSAAGTTRDFIEESVSLNGLPVRLVDTAGLRETGEATEAEGVRLAKELCEKADLVLLVLDYPELVARNFAFDPDEQQLLDLYGTCHDGSSRANLLLVLNKCDEISAQAGSFAAPIGIIQADSKATECTGVSPLPQSFLEKITAVPFLFVSAKQGSGLEELSSSIYKLLLKNAEETQGNLHDNPVPAPNLRQSRQLKLAAEELCAFAEGLARKLPGELVSIHLDSAAEHLANITGLSTSQDILNQIFSEFCIGK